MLPQVVKRELSRFTYFHERKVTLPFKGAVAAPPLAASDLDVRVGVGWEVFRSGRCIVRLMLLAFRFDLRIFLIALVLEVDALEGLEGKSEREHRFPTEGR